MSVLIDSVILIDHLNGYSVASRYLQQLEGGRISVITRAEVLGGVAPASLEPVRRLLDRYLTLEISRDIADLAAELRRSFRWRLPDAFQAALAQRYDLSSPRGIQRTFPRRSIRSSSSPTNCRYGLKPYTTSR